MSLFFGIAMGSSAWASGAIEAGVSAVTIGSPSATTYPGAFTGTGIEIQLDYFFNNSAWGLSLGALNEGNGKLETMRGRYYFLGHAQPPPVTGEEEKTGTVVLQPKTRGVYVEAGLGIFQLTQTTMSASQTGQQTTAGEGGLVAIGLEQPLFSSFFFGLRATLFSSFGSVSVNPVFGEILVGVPFGF